MKQMKIYQMNDEKFVPDIFPEKKKTKSSDNPDDKIKSAHYHN